MGRPDMRGEVLDRRLAAMGMSIDALLWTSRFNGRNRELFEGVIAVADMTDEMAARLAKITGIPADVWTWIAMDDQEFDNHIAEHLIREAMYRVTVPGTDYRIGDPPLSLGSLVNHPEYGTCIVTARHDPSDRSKVGTEYPDGVCYEIRYLNPLQYHLGPFYVSRLSFTRWEPQ